MFPGDHEMYNNVDSPYPEAHIKIHSDERRTAWLEVFKGSNMPGDLTVTWVEPGALLAWHRHEHQDDWMLVLAGTLKVGCWRGDDPEAPEGVQWEVLTDRDPKPLVIERGWWHGYQNIGPGRACVVTYITQRYNPADEFRKAPVEVNLSWERVAR